MRDLMPTTKYKVEIVDLDYYQKQIACQAACPVHTDARGYVNNIFDAKFEAGYIRARQPNPFASTCGRVCAAHCEKACRRGNIDAPITIRALKRFLCERYGVESMTHLPLARPLGKSGTALLSGFIPENAFTRESFAQLSGEAEKKKVTGLPVAVIGAGPAGLTAAHDLAMLGYQVTIFEGSPVLGGMAVLGVPEYRLPRDLLKLEMDEILSLGVEVRLNSRLGRDFNLSTLRQQGFRSIFLAIGAHKDQDLEIEGRQLDGVLHAVDFLLNVNLGYRVKLGDRIAVIGGGDVAIDVARSAARIAEDYRLLQVGDVITALDTARNALRLGVREVHIVYRGAKEEMRASEEELQDALQEGIVLHTGRAPQRVVGQAGKVVGLETVATRSTYDAQRRRTLLPVPGSESVMDVSSVILAIGQQSDLSFLQPQDGVAVSPQGRIVADRDTLATSTAGIYAGGDVVFGPRTIIEAVADGHRAARGMHRYLSEGRSRVVRQGRLVEVPLSYLPSARNWYISAGRPSRISLERRTGIAEVELAYPEELAKEQAGRCLKCHVQTVFDGDLCIVCGGCVDICPYNCLKLVHLDEIEGSPELRELIAARYGAALKAAAVMIKDETHCVRCGLCYRRCPTGAITMEAFYFQEELTE